MASTYHCIAIDTGYRSASSQHWQSAAVDLQAGIEINTIDVKLKFYYAAGRRYWWPGPETEVLIDNQRIHTSFNLQGSCVEKGI